MMEDRNEDVHIQEDRNEDVHIQEAGNEDVHIQETRSEDVHIQETGNEDVHIQEALNEMENVDNKHYEAVVEAILFSMGEAVPLSKISAALELEEEQTRDIMEKMKMRYQQSNRGIQIIAVDDAYQMCTNPAMYEYLIRITSQPKKNVLTDVLLETLSIIAYKQPVTKAEIEKIRGVSCEHAVNKLMEYCLVKELGRLNAPGHPLLFGTTEEFLRAFGVTSVDELPILNPEQLENIKEEAAKEMQVEIMV